MFSRFARNIRTFLPLSLAFFGHQYSNPLFSLDSQPDDKVPQAHRIKFITDIGEYIDKQNDPNRAVLICQLHEDQFIDSQLVKLAQDFVRVADGNVSADFDFLLVKGNKMSGEQLQNYLIIYSNRGEKIINLESYINHNKKKPYLKVSTVQLMKRLVEAINGHRELSLVNLAEQLSVIQNTNNYSALAIVPDAENPKKTEEELSDYLKTHQIKSKTCSKYIVQDHHSRKVLGLSGKAPGIYLLTPINNNLLPEVKEKADGFKIGQKSFIVVPANDKIEKMFTFPPVQPQIKPDQIVLNVYINKNMNTAELERDIVVELSKPQYSGFQKGIYYTSEVEEASLTLEMNDYSKIALTAFDPEKPISPSKVKEILQNTYEWTLPLRSDQPIETASLQQWISACTGERKMELQTFKSKKGGEGWSTVLTGSEYKAKIQEPGDKVIYHYSSHCHGCKKFGGKFQQFARNRLKFPGVSFYRINNDKNKSEGVRNFNSTPVFAYYKQHCLTPFVYRMPIFTQELFDAFIRITGGISLMDPKILKEAIQKKVQADPLIKELMTSQML